MTDTQQDRGLAAGGTVDGNRDGPSTPEHQDYCPGHAPGAAGVKAVVTSLRRAFSDFKLEIEDMVVAGDTVWTRNVATGTNDVAERRAPTGRRPTPAHRPGPSRPPTTARPNATERNTYG